MAVFNLVQKKIKNLINLMLIDGVQPKEIANNIFLDDYESISYKKFNDVIIGEIMYNELVNSQYVKVILRYYYSMDKKVIRIEEELLGKVNIIWDRDYKQEHMIREIVELMQKAYTKKQIEAFVSTLPESIRIKIENIRNEIA